ETFNFAGGTPSGVAVLRTGGDGLASHRTAAATVAIVDDDVLRYEYNAAGTKLGLLCEKARTNLFPNSRNPGAVMTASSGVTKTNNYGTAPNGLTESTRIQYAGGEASKGLI